MGTVTDAEGKPRRLWALIVTLSASRDMHVWPTFSQTVEDVCAGLDAAWRFFGGVPKHVVLDNASSMVIRASKTDPTLNRAFRDYTEARKIFADTARARTPKDKARVENQVPYVRERCFAGEVFTADLGAIRRHAETWCREVAGARVHGTTSEVPREVYERDELPHIQPAPATTFDVPHWYDPKAHPDHRPGTEGAVLGADPLHRQEARRTRRSLVGAPVPGHRADQDAPAQGGRTALDGSEGLSAGEGGVGAARRGRRRTQRARARCHRRRLRRAAARRPGALDQAPAGIRAPPPVPALRPGSGQRAVRPRARVRGDRRATHRRDAQGCPADRRRRRRHGARDRAARAIRPRSFLVCDTGHRRGRRTRQCSGRR